MTERGHDCITPLGSGDAAIDAATFRRLRLEVPPSASKARASRSSCVRSAVTSGVEPSRPASRRRRDSSSGPDFAWENTWEEGPYRTGYEDIGPFLFEFRSYRAALTLDPSREDRRP